MNLNKILTSINGWLKVQIYGQTDINGNPLVSDTLEGHALGTSDQSSTGELGTKVIVIAQRGPGTPTGSTVTPHPAAMAASGNVVFPAGATQVAFLLLTGTGTVGGVAWPLGVAYNNTGPLTSTLTVTTGATSTAITDYSTTP